MRLRFVFVSGLCFFASAAAGSNLKRVLVFEKHLAASVEPYAAADSLIVMLSRAQGFSVRITSDSTMINDDTLGRFQVIVWNNVMRNVLSTAQQGAFERYMENGGGYVGFHASATNRRIWPWYVDDFLGGDNYDSASIAWGNTYVYTDTVKRVGHEIGEGHFIMHGVPKIIPQYGEWYDWNPNPADNPAITVLQWYQPKPIKSSWPAALPASWCREYGAGQKRGRLFYVQVSHLDSVYASAWYRTMVGNALQWTAHDDVVEAGALRRMPEESSRKKTRKPTSVYKITGRKADPMESSEAGQRRFPTPPP